MVTTVLLLGLLTVATATDLRSHKIYNWTTYPGMLIALGLNALGSLLVTMEAVDSDRLIDLGWIELSQSLAGLLVCGAILLVCFVLFRVGGGDVKLIAMMGAFLGLHDGFEAMLWTFILGGCLGLIVLIWRVGPVRLITRSLRHLFWTIRLGSWSALTPGERAQLQPPLFLAPSALLGTVIVRFGLIGV